MKLLVLSDSHSVQDAMRRFLDEVRPDVAAHLGDHYADAQALACAYPDLPFYCVAGNCDRYRVREDVPLLLTPTLGGVPIYMAHGHMHHVKYDPAGFAAAAQCSGAGLALFGHTHVPFCTQLSDGMWLLNPGSCSGARPTAGLVTIENGAVTDCRILYAVNREENL